MDVARLYRSASTPSSVLFLCLFTAQAALLVLSPILPQVADEFGVSTGTAGQLRAASGLTAGIGALLLSWASRGVSLRRLLLAGLGLLAAGALWSAVAGSFGQLVAAQVLIGGGLAVVLSSALAATEVWAPPGGQTRALSWALIGQPVAWIIGQPVVGLVSEWDWRWAWVAVPLAASLTALVAVAARREPHWDVGGIERLGLWHRPGVPGWALGELAALSSWAGTLVFAGALLAESYGTSTSLTGLVLGLVAAAYLPGNFLARRWVASAGRALLVTLPLGMAALVTVYGVFRPNIAVTAVLLALLAAAAGARTISGAAVGLQLAQGRRLAAMGARTAGLQFGYLTGSAVGGAALDLGGYAAVGGAFAVLFVLSSLFQARSLPSPRRASSSEPEDSGTR